MKEVESILILITDYKDQSTVSAHLVGIFQVRYEDREVIVSVLEQRLAENTGDCKTSCATHHIQDLVERRKYVQYNSMGYLKETYS